MNPRGSNNEARILSIFRRVAGFSLISIVNRKTSYSMSHSNPSVRPVDNLSSWMLAFLISYERSSFGIKSNTSR